MVAEDDAEGMADWVGEDPEAHFLRMCPACARSGSVLHISAGQRDG